MTMFLNKDGSVIVVMISTPCATTTRPFSSSTNHGIVIMVVAVGGIAVVMKQQ